ncbi:MAG: ribonuclease Z [Aureispira sp.]
MGFNVTILGISAATPAYGRHLSAQVVEVEDEVLLIDCGEGTQFQLLRYKLRFQKINRIFISHLHGDHYFGLVGLLMTFGLNDRKEALHIYSPPGLEALLERQLEGGVNYALHFHESDPNQSQVLYESKTLCVRSIPLVHRVPCHGFLVEEQLRSANMRKDKIKEYAIPYQVINAIKEGGDYQTPDGETIPHEELTTPPATPLRFAYCSDTRYQPNLKEYIEGVDLLYHEATFLQEALAKAEKTQHTTAQEAGQLAAATHVKKLVLGHFSARYLDLTPLLEEAQQFFEATELAEEGKRLVLKD